MKRKISLGFTILSGSIFAITLLAGCASEPTLGERMIKQSTGTEKLGRTWEDGSEKVVKGEKLIEEGKEMIEDGRDEMRDGEDKVSEGRDLVEKGQKMMQDSEREYRLKFPNAK